MMTISNQWTWQLRHREVSNSPKDTQRVSSSPGVWTPAVWLLSPALTGHVDCLPLPLTSSEETKPPPAGAAMEASRGRCPSECLSGRFTGQPSKVVCVPSDLRGRTQTGSLPRHTGDTKAGAGGQAGPAVVWGAQCRRKIGALFQK